MTASGSTGFAINAEEGEFNTRCNDVFAGLASLEKKHVAMASVQSRNRDDVERSRLVKPDPREDPVQPQPRARGTFRQPHGRARHARYSPGFKKDPEKWTSYDLSDVPRDQLSERGNTAAALAFLQERRQAKMSQEDLTPADLSKKVEFSHRSKSDDSSDKSESGEKKFCGGKLVMPEYDMGQKKIKPKWQRVAASGAGSSGSGSINLDYLQDSDDDDMEVDSKVVSKSMRKRKADEMESDVKLGVESLVIDKDNTKSASQSSDSCTTEKTEIKFKKVGGKRGIRRRQKDDEDEDE